jgi:hypothetical protein
MPSHTFTRVGYWKESAATNVLSEQAAMRDDAMSEALHAMDYQIYAYLQMADDQKAREVVARAPQAAARLNMGAVGGAAPAAAGVYATAAIPARYALERGAWAEAAALSPAATPFPTPTRSPDSRVRSAPPAADSRRRRPTTSPNCSV